MAERLQLRAYNATSIDTFKDALVAAVKETGGRIEWNTHPSGLAVDCRTAHQNHIHTLFIPYLGGIEHQIATALGVKLAEPWIELFIQEGTIWEYMLYEADTCIDIFSVAPEYWSNDDNVIRLRRGDSRLLSETWAVPIDKLRRYLVNWQMREIDEDTFEFRLTGKAYSDDYFEYGTFNQVFDFLRVLGGSGPYELVGWRESARSLHQFRHITR